MATTTEQVTFDELDVMDSSTLETTDKLLVEDVSYGIVKTITHCNLIAGEVSTREAADTLLQGQITTLAGDSGVAEKLNVSTFEGLLGACCGLATLDENGTVPTSQLPSYVDDVIEAYYNSSDGAFYESYDEETEEYSDELTPESGKVYIDMLTNVTYRWSGSVYAVIGSDLALGETSSTAYRGDRGAIAYAHSQVTSGNPHNVTASEVGLGNVPNVATNDQTPTYTVCNSNTELTSGETLTSAFGKIAKAVSSFISHLANVSNPHSVTKSQVGLGNVENYGRTTTVTSGSTCYVSSGGVYSAISGLTSCTGTVTSVAVSVNGTTCGTVTSNGTIALTDIASATTLATATSNISALQSCTGLACTGTVKCISVNSGTAVTPDSNGLVNLTVSSGGGTVTSVNVSVNGVSGTAVTTSGTVTLSNVPPYFANGTLYKVGDDVCIGDVNQAGMLGIRSQNSAVMAGIKFIQCSGTASGCLYACSSDNCLYWNGTKLGSNELTIFPYSCLQSAYGETETVPLCAYVNGRLYCLGCVCNNILCCGLGIAYGLNEGLSIHTNDSSIWLNPFGADFSCAVSVGGIWMNSSWGSCSTSMDVFKVVSCCGLISNIGTAVYCGVVVLEDYGTITFYKSAEIANCCLYCAIEHFGSFLCGVQGAIGQYGTCGIRTYCCGTLGIWSNISTLATVSIINNTTGKLALITLSNIGTH